MAPMLDDSRLPASLLDMSASLTPNITAATIITVATVAFRSKPPGMVRVFFGAFLASAIRR